MNSSQNSDLPIVLLILAAVLLFVGIRAIKKRRILKGRSSSEYIEGKKAEIWGWVYTISGIILALVSIIMMV